ncbi:hypothetical protein BHE74_00037830 [Ensete ventricosum]|uniref:Uncharacterized protein n=1 Tax=Ensete ventricosum TaxID=4639 RepID=A0A426ZXL0_ENSVE|nr:hypothetical protein B296_00023362 [Ensete ventricosum]RWW26032.1 hypothetical protein GW17_00009605 [Ensete ventricosum]RWW55532.1 hypothetical protein BHE74_00037830 [Ensete ventricosum]RZS08550.1 hypothetical protein BHM03_00039546 [Ensete ventricosum]
MELIVDSGRSLPLTALFHHPLLQQECEELAKRVTDLESENSALRVEIESLKKLRGELKAKNKSITEKLKQRYGPEIFSELGISIDPSKLEPDGASG